ncbi:MAG: HipA N-terminal domain-containing protein [Verrucomicrobia bacterium]|nr:HipA N-terminal domain-containing protein [Verrucomicrobiota bacterium]MBS0635870.1 HipA N-terminal domain-containing protein [Verrucomicrobiota bacterium]
MRQFKIIGVSLFLEKRKTRIYVGKLERKDNKYVFIYDDAYFVSKNALAFAPEFPLTQRAFESEKLFGSFLDRIPSHENPAYVEYCESMGIDPKEKDTIVLLASIGRKGPSSFIFYPIYERKFTVDDVIQFRHLLGFTTREFSKIFEISQSSLNALERNRGSGKDILKHLEVIYLYPAIALDYLLLNGGILIHKKWIHAGEVLSKRKTDITISSSPSS